MATDRAVRGPRRCRRESRTPAPASSCPATALSSTRLLSLLTRYRPRIGAGIGSTEGAHRRHLREGGADLIEPQQKGVAAMVVDLERQIESLPRHPLPLQIDAQDAAFGIGDGIKQGANVTLG